MFLVSPFFALIPPRDCSCDIYHPLVLVFFKLNLYLSGTRIFLLHALQGPKYFFKMLNLFLEDNPSMLNALFRIKNFVFKNINLFHCKLKDYHMQDLKDVLAAFEILLRVFLSMLVVFFSLMHACASTVFSGSKLKQLALGHIIYKQH